LVEGKMRVVHTVLFGLFFLGFIKGDEWDQMAEKSGTFFESAFKMLDDESAGKIFGRISIMASTIGRFIPLVVLWDYSTKMMQIREKLKQIF
jgi:hypothetical protein